MTDFKRLLLVDDDKNDLELFRMAMQRIGLQQQVATAHDGVEALEYLERQPSKELPKLLLIDFKMSRMDGLHLLKKLQKNPKFKRIPKVMLTSSQASEDITRAYAAGANAYVIKPVEFSKFYQEVETLVKFWLDINLVDTKIEPAEI